MEEYKVLDDILLKIGFGKQQILAFSLIGLLIMIYSPARSTYLFTALDSDYRCFVPNCDDELNPNYDSDWIRDAIPSNPAGKLRKCEMYAEISTNGNCSAENFDTTKIVQCSSHIFKDDEYYINRKYNILCEENRWKLSLVGSINTLGMLFGSPVTGFLSDRYGRKILLLLCITLNAGTGLLRLVSPTFEWFCACEFLDALLTAGSYQSACILATELVIPKYRAWIVGILGSFYSTGQMLVAVVAWIWRDWRAIIYVLYIPPTFSICLYWFIPESIRWYSSKGKLEQAMKTLRKFTNEKTIPRSYFHALQRNTLEQDEKNRSISFVQMLKSTKLLIRLINCCIMWVTCLLVWYGFTLYSVALTTNAYLNVCLVSVTEIIGCMMIPKLAGKIGRKTLIYSANFLCFSSSVACIFVNSTDLLNILIYCLGKYGSTINFHVVLMVTTEVFPTPLRHTTLAICSMMGRLGSMISPQMTLLGHFWQPLPLIVFASTSTICGILACFLPETLNIKLPGTIKEAENINKKSRDIELDYQ